jgi:energy-coupling factor transporter ATP-binding protein EcfA2
MIKKITIEGFKSLKSVSLDLGPMNIFVGSNASGKSNFFDALRVLQGVGYGFTVGEIFNGKPKGPTSEVWEPIRGGIAKAAFEGAAAKDNVQDERLMNFSVELEPQTRNGKKHIRYSIGLSARWESVRSESLEIDHSPVYTSQPLLNLPDRPVIEVKYYHGKRGRQPQLEFEKTRPVLQQLLRMGDLKESVVKDLDICVRALSNVQRIDPRPAVLREYAQAAMVQRMGERGENFAALANAVLQDAKTKEAYISWLKHLTPSEMDDVVILRGALQEPLFGLRERNVESPAHILSDGTLRFAAITAAFFQPDMPEVLTIEEIENAIHASRLRLLVELLRNRTESGSVQVIATTHSPIILAWLKESEYRHTFFCQRDRQTAESKIRALSDIPEFKEILGKQPISDLFAEGWLETVL